MTLNKNILFLPVLSLVAINNNNYANAATKKVDGLKKTSFFDRFYVKGNAYLGYSYSKLSVNTDHSSSVSFATRYDTIQNIDGEGMRVSKIGSANFDNDASAHTSRIINSPAFGIGGNLYFKINSRFHAFLGVDATARMMKAEFDNKTSMHRDYEYITNEDKTVQEEGQFNGSSDSIISYAEYAKLNAKLGMKIVLHKNFAIEPYALAGINLARTSANVYCSDKLNHHIESYSDIGEFPTEGRELNSGKRLNVGSIFGAGINFVFKERYTLGVEYWRSNNKISSMSFNAVSEFKSNNIASSVRNRIAIDNVMVKFGVQF